MSVPLELEDVFEMLIILPSDVDYTCVAIHARLEQRPMSLCNCNAASQRRNNTEGVLPVFRGGFMTFQR